MVFGEAKRQFTSFAKKHKLKKKYNFKKPKIKRLRDIDKKTKRILR